MYRFIEEKIDTWLKGGGTALMVSGARQVGKTYTIRKALADCQTPYFEIDLSDKPDILKALKTINGTKEIVNRLRLYSPAQLPEKGGVIFFDNVQEFPEIITKIKFLVEEGSLRYILAGSYLDTELNNIRSVPVGYYSEIKMYPMNFLEFIKAYGVSDTVIGSLRQSYEKKEKVDRVIHEKMLELFTYYLLTGGLPRAVLAFLETHNLSKINNETNKIISLYRADFLEREALDKKYRLTAIYNSIPAQLSKKNLRFTFASLDKELKFDRYEKSFGWLEESGVAYPCYRVREIGSPLISSRAKNFFKLFMNDTGLLVSSFPFSLREKILSSVSDKNSYYVSLFQNFVMQELVSNGLKPCYYKDQTIGEIDFVVEKDDGIWTLAVKSGSDYKKHRPIDNLMKQKKNEVRGCFVLSPNNLFVEGDTTYLPIYMAGLIDNRRDMTLAVPKISI